MLRISALSLLGVLLPAAALAQPAPVDFDTARHIVAARCSFCHTSVIQEDGLNAGSQPAKGIKFDTPADMRKFAPLMLDVAVNTRRMPPDNMTHISDEERATLGRWIEAGAPIP